MLDAGRARAHLSGGGCYGEPAFTTLCITTLLTRGCSFELGFKTSYCIKGSQGLKSSLASRSSLMELLQGSLCPHRFVVTFMLLAPYQKIKMKSITNVLYVAAIREGHGVVGFLFWFSCSSYSQCSRCRGQVFVFVLNYYYILEIFPGRSLGGWRSGAEVKEAW